MQCLELRLRDQLLNVSLAHFSVQLSGPGPISQNEDNVVDSIIDETEEG